MTRVALRQKLHGKPVFSCLTELPQEGPNAAGQATGNANSLSERRIEYHQACGFAFEPVIDGDTLPEKRSVRKKKTECKKIEGDEITPTQVFKETPLRSVNDSPNVICIQAQNETPSAISLITTDSYEPPISVKNVGVSSRRPEDGLQSSINSENEKNELVVVPSLQNTTTTEEAVVKAVQPGTKDHFPPLVDQEEIDFNSPPRIMRNASAPAELFAELFKTKEFADLLIIAAMQDDTSVMTDMTSKHHRQTAASPTTACLPVSFFLNKVDPNEIHESEGPLVLVSEAAAPDEAPIVLVGTPTHSTYVNPIRDSYQAASLYDINDKENWAWFLRGKPNVPEHLAKHFMSETLHAEEEFLIEKHGDEMLELESGCAPFSVPCLMLGNCQGCSETCADDFKKELSIHDVNEPDTNDWPYALLVAPTLSSEGVFTSSEEENIGFEAEAIFAVAS